MSDEAAKMIADAIRELAAAIEKMTGGAASIGSGVHVHHHNAYPSPTYGGGAGGRMSRD